MEYTFCELKCKDVINIIDGRRLGRIIDMVFNANRGTICGIVVPGERTFHFFRPSEDIFIPWCNILRIGEDVILVEIMLSPPGGGGRTRRRGKSYVNESVTSNRTCDPNPRGGGIYGLLGSGQGPPD